jgi:hypothetical protein
MRTDFGARDMATMSQVAFSTFARQKFEQTANFGTPIPLAPWSEAQSLTAAERSL